MRPAWVDAEGAGWFAQALGFVLSFPTPAWMALVAYMIGAFVLAHTPFGRHVLAVGGGTDASRLMGLPVDRTIFSVYLLSGGCAGIAGVILASQFGAGQPIEGSGTLTGALLLGLIYTILNFENGLGWISLLAYWQSVVRGLFLLSVVIIQSRFTKLGKLQ